MSTLFDYIRSLLPKFGKDKVAELARQTQNEINNFVLPSYTEAEKGLLRRKFLSPNIADKTIILRRNLANNGNLKLRPDDNIVSIIRQCLELVSKNNQIIETHITETFEDEIIVAGITVLKVNVLQIIESTSFVSRYAGKFLNYVYIVEKAALTADENYIASQLSKGEIEWIEKRFLDFVFSLSILTKNETELLNIISQIPDVQISGNEKVMQEMLGNDRLDPMGFRRLSGFTGNPVMHIRLMVANFQANRYKEQKEIHRVLSLRLMDLHNQQNKTPNARLEQEIEYTQRRVDRLSNEIRSAEESVE